MVNKLKDRRTRSRYNDIIYFNHSVDQNFENLKYWIEKCNLPLNEFYTKEKKRYNNTQYTICCDSKRKTKKNEPKLILKYSTKMFSIINIQHFSHDFQLSSHLCCKSVCFTIFYIHYYVWCLLIRRRFKNSEFRTFVECFQPFSISIESRSLFVVRCVYFQFECTKYRKNEMLDIWYNL